MEINKVLEEKVWEEKISQLSFVNFLQSWKWGDFQELLGNKVTRISVDKGVAQYYFVKSKFSNFLYCPRGPLAESSNAFSKLLDQQIEETREKGADFAIVEPTVDSGFMANVLQEKGFIKQKSSSQPESTSIISLIPDENTIHSQIRKTTRQMIRKALENKVEVKSYQDLSRWNDFANLFMETTQRQKFTSHSLSYIKKQFNCFEGSKNIQLYIAEKDGETLAAAIILSYAKTSVYLHAASNDLGRSLGVAQLLVWTAIQDAKKKGDIFFDLWGISTEEKPNYAWEGITIFKKGFGGETVNYPGSFVLPIRPIKYKVYLLVNLLRSIPLFKTLQRALLRSFAGSL